MANPNRCLGTCSLIIILCLVFLNANAQRGNVWIFGDSARLEFNQPGTTFRSNSWRSWGSASISDTAGNLLFYSTGTPYNGVRESFVYNANNQMLLNGSGIYNIGSINGNLIIPNPTNDSLYYLFCQESYPDLPVHPDGIYYNIINPTKGATGEVIQKNVLLFAKPINGVLSALQHGNGRDWWVFFGFDSLNSSGTAYVPNNILYRVLVSPAGVSSLLSQSIGTPTSLSNSLAFNKYGNMAALCSGSGVIEVYDVDRCTGLLLNPTVICPHNQFLPIRDIEYSGSDRFLYATALHSDSSSLLQIDLQNANPCQSKIALKYWVLPEYSLSISRWLDDKLYTAQSDAIDIFNDTLHTIGNSNIGVIQFPNSLGFSCQFNAYGVYLNGARACGQLPNNPDYELGNLAGSPCDSLATGLGEKEMDAVKLTLFPNPVSSMVTIQSSELILNAKTLNVYSVDGKLLHSEDLPENFFKGTFDFDHLHQGLYLIVIGTDTSFIQKRFQKL